MSSINRDPDNASRQKFDIIIIGGGIYGAMLSLEAVKKGLHTLLLEKNDFGSATSFNSLRILHGGLRYLQKFDLPRFRESVNERRWFLKNFPELTEPLPCMMPLYGKGLHKPSILRLALFANDLLSFYRNHDLSENRRLPSGSIADKPATIEIFPGVDSDKLKGSAIWFDACFPDSQRIVMEVLRWAATLGSTALNYFHVNKLILDSGDVKGVIAQDQETKDIYEFRAPVVINATGPWSRKMSAVLDKEQSSLFSPSIAWNILLDRPALSSHALAVSPKKNNAQTYFLTPWKGKILVGTGHKPWDGSVLENPIPSEVQVADFIEDLNNAIPGLSLENKDILRMFAGFLPAATESGDGLAVREVIIDHALKGGARGLYSVSGVKFTTSRLVAEKTVNLILKQNRHIALDNVQNTLRPASQTDWDRLTDIFRAAPSGAHWKEVVARIIKEESVIHLDDLIYRRTTLWEDQDHVDLAPRLCEIFGWDSVRCEDEISRLKNQYNTGVAA